MDIREKMRRDWDRRAKVDPRYWVAATEEADEASYVASGERDTAALIDGLRGRLQADARVLDLGCGIGRMVAPLAARCGEVVGVDVSPEMIEQARALHGDLPNASFEVNSGADLGAFPDGRFEMVFSYSVLPHLPPEVVAAYFAEVNRVLVPGGWFRYQFWIGPERTMADNDTLNIRVYSPEQFQALNRQAGLEVAEIDEIDYFDPVLELKPVWVNARRVADAEAEAGGSLDFDAADSALSDEERNLEYGLLLYLAVKHGERGERDEAERVLEQAVACDPTRPEGWIQWATHRIERDDLDGARTLFESLVEQQPELPVGWAYLAQCALATRKFDLARTAVEKAEALVEPGSNLVEEVRLIRETLNEVAPRPSAGRKKRKVKRRRKK